MAETQSKGNLKMIIRRDPVTKIYYVAQKCGDVPQDTKKNMGNLVDQNNLFPAPGNYKTQT